MKGTYMNNKKKNLAALDLFIVQFAHFRTFQKFQSLKTFLAVP